MPQPSEHEIEVFNMALELPAGERAAYFELSFRERLLEIEPYGLFVDRSASAYEIATCP